jgi:hypothetical protein
MSGSMETQAHAFADEVRGGLERKNWMLDLDHPLLNRIAESFVKAAGVSTSTARSLFAPSSNKAFGLSLSGRLSPDYVPLILSCVLCWCRSARSRQSRGSPTSWPSKVLYPCPLVGLLLL